METDPHGNVRLSSAGGLADLLCEEIKSKLGIERARGDAFGYLERSFAGCVSDVDQREAREVGEFAVKLAIWGASRRLRRDPPDRRLRRRIRLTDLAMSRARRRSWRTPSSPLRERRHAGLSRLFAAIVGPRPLETRAPSRRRDSKAFAAAGGDGGRVSLRAPFALSFAIAVTWSARSAKALGP